MPQWLKQVEKNANRKDLFFYLIENASTLEAFSINIVVLEQAFISLLHSIQNPFRRLESLFHQYQ